MLKKALPTGSVAAAEAPAGLGSWRHTWGTTEDDAADEGALEFTDAGAGNLGAFFDLVRGHAGPGKAHLLGPADGVALN